MNSPESYQFQGTSKSKVITPLSLFSPHAKSRFKLNADSVLFGEAHAEGRDFWKRPNVSITTPVGFTTTTSTANNRVDLSFGGGYRRMLGDGALLGANGFYDSSRIFNKWYSSGGVGLEMAATVGGDDAVDVNVNWYGNLFNKDVLVNAFRNKGNSFDVEAGYSHALFEHALDLRLKVAGYQFDVGQRVGGWRGGADLTTRDGMFTLRYEHGQDRINGDYNTVGGFVTVGLQLENLLSGESPFTRPEPLFKSPRDLRRLLGLKVKRNWHQPASVLMAQQMAANPPGPTPLFTQTFLVGTVASPSNFVYPLNPLITSADLAGVGSLVITWDGGATPTGPVFLFFNVFGTCNGGSLGLIGATSPPGAQTSNPLVWGILCGSWDRVIITNISGASLNFGNMTLSYFP